MGLWHFRNQSNWFLCSRRYKKHKKSFTTFFNLFVNLEFYTDSDIHPSSRAASLTWVTPDGLLWLFGGLGIASDGSSQTDLGDFWNFNLTNYQWTYIGGSTSAFGREDSFSNTWPFARSHGNTWISSHGDLCFLGGIYLYIYKSCKFLRKNSENSQKNYLSFLDFSRFFSIFLEFF